MPDSFETLEPKGRMVPLPKLGINAYLYFFKISTRGSPRLVHQRTSRRVSGLHFLPRQ